MSDIISRAFNSHAKNSIQIENRSVRVMRDYEFRNAVKEILGNFLWWFAGDEGTAERAEELKVFVKTYCKDK